MSVSTGVPYAATSRPVTVRAPVTLTCWPTTVRIAVSSPSTWPGTRSPRVARTSGPMTGSPRNWSSTAIGSQSASTSRRARSTAAAVSRRSCEPELGLHERGLPGRRRRRRARAGRCRGRAGRSRVRAYQPGRRPAPRRPARRGRRGSRAAPGRRTACARRAASSPSPGSACRGGGRAARSGVAA